MITNSAKFKFTQAISVRFLRSFLLLMLGFTVSMTAIASPDDQRKHIVVYGDSLSAGYGMDLDRAWVNLLGIALEPNFKVSNASISGDTSARGRARLGITLEEFKPDIMILELGANDGLQGLPIKNLRDNLDAMIKQAKAADVHVILGGISLPASYGPRYIDQFRGVYKELADEHQLALLDFYREEFVSTPGYIQEDGLHPTEITQPIVRDIVIDFLREQGLIELGD